MKNKRINGLTVFLFILSIAIIVCFQRIEAFRYLNKISQNRFINQSHNVDSNCSNIHK
jgi:hypothetical protein